VRFLRGARGATAAAFFSEASATLQFPPYFGENWDAFFDCVTDLSWLRADALVLGVLDAGRLLEAAPAEAAKCAAVLTETVRHWSGPPKPRPFHVVFQAAPAEAAMTEKRWHALGLTLKPLK
jgi:hypothetical protein